MVSGAPELNRVPQAFWRRFAKFLRENQTGTFSFNTNRGKVASYDAREHRRAEDDD
ncbi:MAG TPA: hypothetical protein VEA16_06320 [Vicinamibacterales bacterium]|nr:hypothetical protein [Vicinamibacterales bacterium]